MGGGAHFEEGVQEDGTVGKAQVEQYGIELGTAKGVQRFAKVYDGYCFGDLPRYPGRGFVGLGQGIEKKTLVGGVVFY